MAQSPAAVAYRLRDGDAIRVDGVLDEAVWTRAQPIGRLTQTEPVEGARPSHATEVRICYDADFLFLAIRCDDDPSEVRGRIMTRDADLDPDDRVEFWIDTFHDQRFAFWFQIGPGGSRGDALISGGGDQFNKSWDGIWDGKSRITARGWEAEVALPFKTLAFKRGLTTWGFNLVRRRKASNEAMRWAAPRIAYRFFQIAQGGTLTGLTGMRQGLGVDFTPYLKATAARDRRARSDTTGTGDFGGELSYRLSPELRMVLTYNTDFAETEVDERQVNLTRFPLFFPEKRDFFLADAGLFEFGLPAGRGGARAPIAFFSRRIGLAGGSEVPILAGGKLVGRVANWNLGVLGTVLDGTAGESQKNVGVLRVSRNLGEESSVGMIATGGRPSGAGSAWTGGLDFKLGDSEAFGSGRALNIWGYWLGTTSSGVGGDGQSYGLRAQLRTTDWSHRVEAVATESAFDPALGFVRRSGQRQYEWVSRYTWRGDGWIRTIRTFVRPRYRTFMDSSTESWDLLVEWLRVEFADGDSIRLRSRRGFERVPAAFDLRSGTTVPVGDYDVRRHEVAIETADQRALAVAAELEVGDIFGGDLMRWQASTIWRPSPLLAFSAEYEVFEVDLPGGSFTTRVSQARLDVDFSPEVSLRNLVQYDTDSKNLSAQSRLRWTITPGSDVFLLGVYGWARADRLAPLAPTTQSTILKLVWSLRF